MSNSNAKPGMTIVPMNAMFAFIVWAITNKLWSGKMYHSGRAP